MPDKPLDAQYHEKVVKERDQFDVQSLSNDPIMKSMLRPPREVVPDMSAFVDRVAEKLRIGEPDIKPLDPEHQAKPLVTEEGKVLSEQEAGTMTGKKKAPPASVGEVGHLLKKGVQASLQTTGHMISNGWKALGDAAQVFGLDRSAFDYIRSRVDEGNKEFVSDDPEYAYKLFHKIFLSVGQAVGDVAKYAGGAKVFGNAVAAMSFIDGMTAYDQGLKETAVAAAKGAGLGEVLHLTGPMEMMYRVPITSGIFGGMAYTGGGETTDVLAHGFTGAMLGAIGGKGYFSPKEAVELFAKGYPIPDHPALIGTRVDEMHLKEMFPGKEITAAPDMNAFVVKMPDGPLYVWKTGEIGLPAEESNLTAEQQKQVSEGAVVVGSYRSLGDIGDLMDFSLHSDFGTLKHESMHYFLEKYATAEEKSAIMRDAERYADAHPEQYPNFDGSEAAIEEVAADLMGDHAIRVPENVVSKAVQAVQKIFGTPEGIRAKIRSGEAWEFRKVEHRRGVPRIPGESRNAYMVRTRVPEYHAPPKRKKNGNLVGASYNYSTPQAREGLIRRFVRVASDMFAVNPEQAMWYEKAGERLRDIFGLKRGEDGKWTGNIKGVDTFARAIAAWSLQMPVDRNVKSAIEVLKAIAEGREIDVPGSVVSAENMAARFLDIKTAEEISTDLFGLGPKAVSFYWDIINATFGIRDGKNSTIDTHIIQALGLLNANGKPMQGLKSTQYAWARDVMEEITRRFNKQNGTDFDPRNVQALIWEWNRLGQQVAPSEMEGIHTYLPEGAIPPEVASAKYEVRPTVNIGLETIDGRGITAEEAAAELRRLGVNIEQSAVHQSDTEPTFVAQISRPLSSKEAEQLSVALRQGAIAQAVGKSGELYGPEAASWGAFNPDFFLMPSGERMSGKSEKYQVHKYIARNDNGQDMTPFIEEAAKRESVPVNRLTTEDRVWLMPDGKAIRLNEWDIHEMKANEIGGKGGYYGYLQNHQFASSIGGAIRFHGLQKSYNWATGKELAFEVYGPPTKAQWDIIKKSVGPRVNLLADITNPITGQVLSYAEGTGEAGVRALDRAVKKYFHRTGAKAEVRTIETPEGAFPENYKDWRYEGRYEGYGYHQYTNYDKSDPAYGATILVKSPADLIKKTAEKSEQFRLGKEAAGKAEVRLPFEPNELVEYFDKGEWHPARMIGQPVSREGKEGKILLQTPDVQTGRFETVGKTTYEMTSPGVKIWWDKENVRKAEGEHRNLQFPISEKAEVRFPGPKGMRLDKMYSLDEPGTMDRIKDLVKQDWSEIDQARRGTVTFDEAYAKAEKLIESGDFSFQKFLHHPIGKNWPTPEHGIAARMYASKAWQEFADAHAAFEAGTATEADLADKMAVAEAAGRVAYGGTAETGRTLAFYRAPVLSSGRTWTPEEMAGVSKFMQDLRTSGMKPAEVAQKLVKLSPRQLAKLSADLETPGAWDMFTELWINSLLSNPATHAANALSNMIVLTGLVAERQMAGMSRATANGVRRAFGGKPVEGVATGEAGAMVQALLEGFSDSMRLAARTVKTGESSFGVGKVEGRQGPAVTTENLKELANQFTAKLGGKKMMDSTNITWIGRSFDFIGDWIIRGPGKGLLAGDEFFKALNYRMEIAAQAYRKALAGEGQGAELGDRYQFLKENPTPEMKASAFDFAKYATFTDSGGKFTQAIMQFREAHPTVRLVLPFVKTPSRIAHFSFQRMPLVQALSGQLRADLMGADTVKRDLAIAKIGSASIAAATVAGLVAAGAITGGGPRDRKMKALLQSQGWMPYSIRIPGTNKWVTYDRLDPAGAIFAVIADYVELRASMNPEEGESGIDAIPVAISLAFAQAFVSKTYMQGMANAIDSVTAPDRSIAGFGRRLAGTAVPALVGGINRNVFDGYIREIQSSMDAIKARVPGYSDTLPPRRDPWGNPSVNHGWGLGIFLPFRKSEIEEDPASQELINLGISVPPISKYFGGATPPLPESVQNYFVKDTRKYGVKWSDVEYDELMRAYGNHLKVDWSGGGPEVVGYDAKGGDGMHDYLNKIVTDKEPLPMEIALPDGDIAVKYSQLPAPEPGVPGEDLRSIVLRVIMRTYKSLAEDWYLNYQAQQSGKAGKKSMRQTQVEREGAKAIRKGANPQDVQDALGDIIPQIGR